LFGIFQIHKLGLWQGNYYFPFSMFAIFSNVNKILLIFCPEIGCVFTCEYTKYIPQGLQFAL
jgi:hypothetical protein